MGLEQEIKLGITIDDELDLAAIKWLADYADRAPQQQHLISHYFDSADGVLFKNGYGLRRRFDGQNWWQTLKDQGKVENGLHQRQEWEHCLQQNVFDLDLLNQTPLAGFINDRSIWSRIDTIFTTDFIRQTWQLVLANQTQIELAYDRGRIYRDQHSVPIHELELELKTGELSQLTALAEQLMAVLPVEQSNISKAQRGYQLINHLT